MFDDFQFSWCTPSPRQTFCICHHSEIEHIEERNLLIFRTETVKLSEIQYKAKECKRQVTTSQQVTTFQLPEATQATAGREYILTIPDTQPVSIPVVNPTPIAITQPAIVTAKVKQPLGPASVSPQPASFLVVDDQQPGPSKQLMFTLSPAKTVASEQQEDKQHNTSGLSSLFRGIPSVLQYQQINKPQPFLPAQLQSATSPVPSSTHQKQSQPPSQPK